MARTPEGPEVLETPPDGPLTEPTMADRIDLALRNYWQDPKVSWERYPRPADYLIATIPEIFKEALID